MDTENTEKVLDIFLYDIIIHDMLELPFDMFLGIWLKKFNSYRWEYYIKEYDILCGLGSEKTCWGTDDYVKGQVRKEALNLLKSKVWEESQCRIDLLKTDIT